MNCFLRRVDPWIRTNAVGGLERSRDFNGLIWVGIPFMAPNLHLEGNHIWGGFFPNPAGNRALSGDLLQVLAQTNLVYYDGEVTGPRIDAWFQVSQLLRLMLRKPQLPSDSAGNRWLVANELLLRECVTEVDQTGPTELFL